VRSDATISSAHALDNAKELVSIEQFIGLYRERTVWKHACTGRYIDAAAYYSSPGGIWDMFWLLVVLLFARQSLSRDYFRCWLPRSGGSRRVPPFTRRCAATRRWPSPATRVHHRRR
jgi:hypothetical protein